MRTKLMRDAIAILMLSPLYFLYPPAVRLDMVYYFVFAQEVAR